MNRHRRLAHGVAAVCGASLLGLVLAYPPLQPRAVASMGNFYAGGHYDSDHPDHHIVGQVYVEYQIPAERKHAFPIVLVHGGGQTGAGWWSTPDGRPGWAQYFLRQGYAVYVVDQIGRGRS